MALFYLIVDMFYDSESLVIPSVYTVLTGSKTFIVNVPTVVDLKSFI